MNSSDPLFLRARTQQLVERLSSLREQVAASPYAEAAQAHLFSLLQDERGVLHADGGWCPELDVSATPLNRVFRRTLVPSGVQRQQSVKVSLAFKDVSAPALCPSCGFSVLSPSHNSTPGPLYNAFQYAAHLESVARLERPMKSTAPALERRRSEAEHLLNLLQSPYVFQDEHVEALLLRVQKVLGALQVTSSDASHRELVLKWVRRDLLPKQFQKLNPDSFALDSSPTLVGIAPYYSGGNTQKVRALVEAFKVHEGPESSVVLLAPRYVCDYLQRTRLGKFSSPTLLVGVAAPLDPVVAETAAALWDPSGTGSLASLADCVTAASALVEV